MLDELPITIDGLRVYDRHGRYAKLTNKECALLECLVETYPRVARYDFLIERLWGDYPPDFSQGCVVQFSRHLTRKLRFFGLAVENDRDIGYRIIKLDSYLQNRQLS